MQNTRTTATGLFVFSFGECLAVLVLGCNRVLLSLYSMQGTGTTATCLLLASGAQLTDGGVKSHPGTCLEKFHQLNNSLFQKEQTEKWAEQIHFTPTDYHRSWAVV